MVGVDSADKSCTIRCIVGTEVTRSVASILYVVISDMLKLMKWHLSETSVAMFCYTISGSVY